MMVFKKIFFYEAKKKESVCLSHRRVLQHENECR